MAAVAGKPPSVAATPRFVGDVRVLIADDADMNVKLLRRTLSKFVCGDWAVDEAATAEEALELIEAASRGHASYDLIVVDEIFSEDPSMMRGSDVIQRLRAAEREAPEPRRHVVVSCTGNEAYQRERLLQVGADEVWSKPLPSATDGTLQRALAILLPRLVL